MTIRSVRQPVGSLSGGQRQAVAVAKAVLREAKLVIMDEPTAALGVTQTRVVLDLIRRLKSQGIAVLVISHNLSDVFEVADRVAVLRLGRMAAVGPLAQFDTESIVDLMTTGTSKRLAAVPAEPASQGALVSTDFRPARGPRPRRSSVRALPPPPPPRSSPTRWAST